MPLTKIAVPKYRGDTEILEVEDLLAKAAADPYYPVPYHVLSSMVEHNVKDSGSEARLSNISISKLSSDFSCPRCTVLQRYEPYTEELKNLWASWMGSMFHTVLEQNPVPNDICEVRLWAQVPGLGPDDIVTGMPDTIRPYIDHLGGAGLFDMKTGKSIPQWDNPYEDHKKQVQMYRWLVNNCKGVNEKDLMRLGMSEEEAIEMFHGLDFKTLGIWYVSSMSEAIKPIEIRTKVTVKTKPGAKYPTKVENKPIVWSDEVVERQLVPAFVTQKENFERYLTDGTLPGYPAGIVSPLPQHYIAHQYSGVADLCLKMYYEDGR